MKDDDSSSIVRSQTAHHVNVSEYTGNATTPQNHVTSDVDRELALSDADPGPTRTLESPAEHAAHEPAAARLNPLTIDADAADPAAHLHLQGQAPEHDPHRHLAAESVAAAAHHASVPVDEFQDELAAIELARAIDHRSSVPTEPVPVDHRLALPEPSLDAAAQIGPADLAGETAWHTAGPADDLPDAGHLVAHDLAAEHDSGGPALGDPHLAEHLAALPSAGDAPHLAAVPLAPLTPEHGASEAKPVFSDSHATLPDGAPVLHDAELDLAELGHVHPLSDPEPPAPTWDAPTTPPEALPSHPTLPHPHLPPHALSPTNAALADLNKDEFQGRLAGIKREVQALNERLTDFEAELDKDGLRPTRP